MIGVVTMLAGIAASGGSIPAGVPYADTPVPQAELRGLEAHPWGWRVTGILYHIRGDGYARVATYFRFKRNEPLAWAWSQGFYTRHGDTIVESQQALRPMTDPAELDEPKPGDACFGVSAVRWTARYLYMRRLDMAATRRANPWLHRKPGDHPDCSISQGEIDLGHLSPADQARLVLRWEPERRAPIAPHAPDVRLPKRVRGLEGPSGEPIPPELR